MPPEDQKTFSLGQVLATPGALQAIEQSGQSPIDFLARHARCDWGCVSGSDRKLNDEAVGNGARILSAYETREGTRLWVITEAVGLGGQRTSTTILLPQEY